MAAAFLTGCRSSTTPKATRSTWFCNGVDGDPRAAASRLLLEADPHTILEGMLILAYALGATHCIVCTDERWTEGTMRLSKALEEAGRKNLVGDRILGSSFSCEVGIRRVTASLVMGQETALLRLLEENKPCPS